MLYRPNYCCHCGEKVVRAKWTPLSSRRFCEFCEVEQKQHDLLPRAAMVIAVLIGAAGLTAYVGGNGSSSSSTTSPSARALVPNPKPNSGIQEHRNANTNLPANTSDSLAEISNVAQSNPKQRQVSENS